MKTDYTITPEYREATLEHRRLNALTWQKDLFTHGSTNLLYMENLRRAKIHVNESVERAIRERRESSDVFGFLAGHQAKAWCDAYDIARKSHAAGEPLIRTVCKIAARILFVLLLVGIAVMVML